MDVHKHFLGVVLLSVLCLYSVESLARNFLLKYRLPTNNFASDYVYETKYFKQKVDHFGFENDDTFNQRYLIADQYWNHKDGPIFFYTGNEGDITWFCNNTGFMWDIADEFKAMLVFAEHRFYGDSIPYGKEAFKDPLKLNFLTSEQALADFAVLITNLKATIPGAAKSSVIAFGGSYGGMLSAWFRMKYPAVVQGALAASAPILQFNGITPCEAFFETVTKPYTAASKECADNIRSSWKAITEEGSTTEGRLFIKNTMKLCKPLNKTSDIQTLKDWLNNVWTDLAMVNYPYPADFLEPLPSWPVKVVCEKLSMPASGKDLIVKLATAVNVYFNYTGKAKCLDIDQQATQDLGDTGWEYQSCTEMVMPMCTNGQTDMFEPSTWNFTTYSSKCIQKWKIKPREDWIREQFGGKNFMDASNIIFSNGLLDPWSSGGVKETGGSDSLIVILISDGAHHLDLRSANSRDTPAVRAARIQEKNILKNWLNQV